METCGSCPEMKSCEKVGAITGNNPDARAVIVEDMLFGRRSVMDNTTAKVSCFARAYHYENNSSSQTRNMKPTSSTRLTGGMAAGY